MVMICNDLKVFVSCGLEISIVEHPVATVGLWPDERWSGEGFPLCLYKEIRRTKTIQNSITPFGKEHQPYNDQFYVGSRRWFPANVFLSSGSGLPSHFCNVSGAEAATRKVPGAAKRHVFFLRVRREWPWLRIWNYMAWQNLWISIRNCMAKVIAINIM